MYLFQTSLFLKLIHITNVIIFLIYWAIEANCCFRLFLFVIWVRFRPLSLYMVTLKLMLKRAWSLCMLYLTKPMPDNQNKYGKLGRYWHFINLANYISIFNGLWGWGLFYKLLASALKRYVRKSSLVSLLRAPVFVSARKNLHSTRTMPW